MEIRYTIYVLLFFIFGCEPCDNEYRIDEYRVCLTNPYEVPQIQSFAVDYIVYEDTLRHEGTIFKGTGFDSEPLDSVAHRLIRNQKFRSSLYMLSDGEIHEDLTHEHK